MRVIKQKGVFDRAAEVEAAEDIWRKDPDDEQVAYWNEADDYSWEDEYSHDSDR